MDIMSLFVHFFNIGVSAASVALVVMLLRLLLRKAPKGVVIALWALVAIRLILPFSIESPVSLLPNAETIPEEIISVDPTKTQEQPVFDVVSNPIYSDYINREYIVTNVNSFQLKTMLATFGWLGVAGLMLLYMLVSYLVVRYKIRPSAPLRDNIYLCDNIDTPFVFGLVKPKIYIPSTMGEEDLVYVLAHEKAHLKRKDYIWKPLGFVLLSFYWFSPVLWISYALFCRDIELACDEAVIKTMGSDAKKAYSNALVNCSVKRRIITACPLAFGEVGVKNRIKAVLNYKKPTLWILLASAVALIVVGACFMTSPEKRNSEIRLDIDIAISEAILDSNSDKSWNGECPAEGHIILGTEEIGEEIRVYFIEEFSSFGFVNGWFISQGGSRTLVNMGFKKVDDGYVRTSTIRRLDGMDGMSNAFFPGKYIRMADNLSDKDLAYLWEQCESYAKEYLKSIGRQAKIGTYSDIEHISLTDVGVSVEVSNRVVNSISRYNVGEIGFYETVENNVRYLYRTSYLPESNRIVYTKEVYGTNEIVEKIEVDALTGNIVNAIRGDKEEYYFDAKVIKTEGDSVLVEPLENSKERKTSDRIWVSTKLATDSPLPSLYEGAYIRVLYDGMIQEVYPAIIPNVSAIYPMADINYIGTEAKESENEEPTTRTYSNPPTTTAPNYATATTLPTASVKKEGFKKVDKIIETYHRNREMAYTYLPFVPSMSTLHGYNYVEERMGLEYIAELSKEFDYSKHINAERSEGMYIIYDKNGFIDSCWYTEKWFSAADFKSITAGSTYEDVVKIDSSTSFKMENAYNGKTYHLIDSGYIVITWSDDATPVVEAIEYVADETIVRLYLVEKEVENG